MPYPLAYSPIRLPDVAPDGALAMADLLHLLTPGKRLVWGAGTPRATFAARGTAGPPPAGHEYQAALVGGGFAYLTAGEWSALFVLQLSGRLEADEVLTGAAATVWAGPPQGAVAGLVQSAQYAGQQEVSFTLGAPGAAPVAGTWYTLLWTVDTSAGRRLQIQLPAIFTPA